MDLEARVAVMEAELQHLKTDITELVKFVREHMEEEEKDRKILIQELNDIKTAQAKMKSFWAGITFTVSMVWAAGAAILYFFGKHSS